MTAENISINRSHLVALLAMAQSYLDDIRSGIAEGLYDPKANDDLPMKQAAVDNIRGAISTPMTAALTDAPVPAISAESLVLGINDDSTRQYVNHYHCPACGNSWEDVWTAMCDDDCPHCGARSISPTRSSDV